MLQLANAKQDGKPSEIPTESKQKNWDLDQQQIIDQNTVLRNCNF